MKRVSFNSIKYSYCSICWSNFYYSTFKENVSSSSSMSRFFFMNVIIFSFIYFSGHKVSKFSICGSKSASNYIVKSMLLVRFLKIILFLKTWFIYFQWLPNIKELNFSYTNICHSAFDDCNIKFLKLTKLDLSGCHFITDHGLKLLFRKIPKNLGNIPSTFFCSFMCRHF